MDLCQKGLAIREQLAEDLGTADSKRDLSDSYNHIAGIFKDDLGGPDNLHQALSLYQKRLVICEQLASELGTAENKRELYFSYHNVVLTYYALGGIDNLQKSLECIILFVNSPVF